MFVHLQTMYRLSLADRRDASGSRIYCSSESITTSRLKILRREIPDSASLEKTVSAHKCVEVAAKIYSLERKPGHAMKLSEAECFAVLTEHYKRIMATGVPLCPMATLIEAVQVDLLTKTGDLMPYDTTLETIGIIQRNHPKEIRFHVDRRGMPAFIRLSE